MEKTEIAGQEIAVLKVDKVLDKLYSRVKHFVEYASGVKLRAYQQCVAEAILASIRDKQGLSFVVMYPRQSGKNELQAQVECFLLTSMYWKEVELVKISPTGKPQNQNAMRRLERVLRRNLITSSMGWGKEGGYVYQVGKAKMYFLSGAPGSNIVGATASVLLEVDEAQDVSAEKYDKEIAPMVAATNATRVFWGTAWTSKTLLARELRAAREAEKVDGIQRAFVISAEEVSREVAAYGKFVAGQVAKLGRNNPMVKTQYFSEEIDAEGGMFSRQRQALMQGRQPRQDGPAPGQLYAITIDVAGEDESARDELSTTLVNPGRDSTAVTVFNAGVETQNFASLQKTAPPSMQTKPSYRVVARHQWTGIKHSSLFARLTAIIDHWQPTWLVIDATGVGQTLTSFLQDQYAQITMPFVFTSSSKSALGWNFIALIETGRYKEYLASGEDALQGEFWTQVEHTQYSILDGPGQVMRWGVPDGTRDPATGELVHDDLVISAALVSALDDRPFGRAESKVVPGPELFGGKEF